MRLAEANEAFSLRYFNRVSSEKFKKKILGLFRDDYCQCSLSSAYWTF